MNYYNLEGEQVTTQEWAVIYIENFEPIRATTIGGTKIEAFWAGIANPEEEPPRVYCISISRDDSVLFNLKFATREETIEMFNTLAAGAAHYPDYDEDEVAVEEDLPDDNF